MKKVVILCILMKCISAQDYIISVFGFPVAEVKQTRSHHSTITFETRNTGIADLIWPAKNFYSAQFDSASFGIRGWDKKIHQGEFKKKLSADFNPATTELIYSSKNKVQITDKTQTIFTLLAMVQAADYRELDTHWFPFEHEGQLGKARFVWSDTATINYRKNKELCDHYRLDIIINDDSGKFRENSDYFMDEIIASGIVRQLWVSRETQKRIIQASIKTMGLPLIALIDE
ncbi:MAG: hypothetical protein QGI47_02225 [Candidatus Marinimicrobia bacterium]|nr:hypothetical protein [Candidatus Neomarinimicrobiota bacterium]